MVILVIHGHTKFDPKHRQMKNSSRVKGPVGLKKKSPSKPKAHSRRLGRCVPFGCDLVHRCSANSPGTWPLPWDGHTHQ